MNILFILLSIIKWYMIIGLICSIMFCIFIMGIDVLKEMGLIHTIALIILLTILWPFVIYKLIQFGRNMSKVGKELEKECKDIIESA